MMRKIEEGREREVFSVKNNLTRRYFRKSRGKISKSLRQSSLKTLMHKIDE